VLSISQIRQHSLQAPQLTPPLIQVQQLVEITQVSVEDVQPEGEEAISPEMIRLFRLFPCVRMWMYLWFISSHASQNTTSKVDLELLFCQHQTLGLNHTVKVV